MPACKKCKGTGYEVRLFGMRIGCKACKLPEVKWLEAANERRYAAETKAKPLFRQIMGQH